MDNRFIIRGILPALRRAKSSSVSYKWAPSLAGLQAWIYAGIGDREHTLQVLEKDESQRGVTTLFLRDDAKLDLMGSDPRFIALLKKTHLDPN